MDDLYRKYSGSLLGLAIGDAMGAPMEGLIPGQFQPVDGFRDGGQHGLRAGQWTDDTSMALCLADSLTEKGCFDPADQMERYVRWYRHGYLSATRTAFGYGATTTRALERFITWGEPYMGDTSDLSASNGSLMRIAPIPLFYRSTPELALLFARQSSRTTHANIVVLEACQYLTALIIKALNGAEKSEVLFGDLSSWPGYEGRMGLQDFADHLRPTWHDRSAREVEPKTYVLDTLSCALWALQHASSFQEGLLMAVNLGGDSDTVAAVYGQLAGALYGREAIPESWIAGLHQAPLIESYARRLWQAAC